MRRIQDDESDGEDNIDEGLAREAIAEQLFDEEVNKKKINYCLRKANKNNFRLLQVKLTKLRNKNMETKKTTKIPNQMQMILLWMMKVVQLLIGRKNENRFLQMRMYCIVYYLFRIGSISTMIFFPI